MVSATVAVPCNGSAIAVAKRLSVVTLETDAGVTVKGALVVPSGIVTVMGGIISALSELMVTMVTPSGAGPSRVTKPETGFPPGSASGDTDMLLTPGGSMVRKEYADPPETSETEMRARFSIETGTVLIMKVVEVNPPTINVLPATNADALSLAILIVRPSSGAGKFEVMVPMEERIPPGGK